MAGLSYARKSGTPLNAHLVIHWGGTTAGDDPDGKIFAGFRHLFDKRLKRRNIPGGLSGIWVRERHGNRHTDSLSIVEHSHLLFHLPEVYQRGPRRAKIETVIRELVDFVGNGDHDARTVKLTFPEIPDGKYFLKGGTEKVWHLHDIPAKWRSYQGEGLIAHKRCGTTQNIGPKARARMAQTEEGRS